MRDSRGEANRYRAGSRSQISDETSTQFAVASSVPSGDMSKGWFVPWSRMNRNGLGDPPVSGTSKNSWFPSAPSPWKPIRFPSGHHTGQPPASERRLLPEPSLPITKMPPEKERSGLKAIHFPSGDHRGTVEAESVRRRASPPETGAT